jgi:hypothetical protein
MGDAIWGGWAGKGVENGKRTGNEMRSHAREGGDLDMPSRVGVCGGCGGG